MNRRILPLGGLLLLAAGCFDDTSNLLVSPSPFSAQPRTVSRTMAAHAAAAAEVSKHVEEIGRKIVLANPEMGLRPVFQTIGAPQAEVFHQAEGASFKAVQIFITEGLVRKCRNDGELAAVLALEMGKVVSEREALVPSSLRQNNPRPPQDVPVGNDSRGPFGSPDGTRYVEMARFDKQRVAPNAPSLPPPAPESLARRYLAAAGYAETNLADVMPALRQAEDNTALEAQIKSAPGK